MPTPIPKGTDRPEGQVGSPTKPRIGGDVIDRSLFVRRRGVGLMDHTDALADAVLAHQGERDVSNVEVDGSSPSYRSHSLVAAHQDVMPRKTKGESPACRAGNSGIVTRPGR